MTDGLTGTYGVNTAWRVPCRWQSLACITWSAKETPVTDLPVQNKPRHF